MHNQREVDVPSTELDPNAQLLRMRDTPVDALADNEPLIRPNNGRQVVPRMEPVLPSPGDLSATVASSGRCHVLDSVSQEHLWPQEPKQRSG